MSVYADNPKPRAAVAKETPRTTPLDNLDLDVADAMRLGYGVHYGKFKADHPYTKDANEERLQEARKKRRAPAAPKGPKLYDKVCPACGKKFTTQRHDRKYCGDECKTKVGAKKYCEERKRKKEVTA